MIFPLVRHTTSPIDRQRAAAHRRVCLAADGQPSLGADPGAHTLLHRLGVADGVKGDLVDAAFYQALQKCSRVAVTAAARIIGVVGDDQRLVAGLAIARQRHRLGNRKQFEAAEVARLPQL